MLSVIRAGSSLAHMARPTSYGHLVPCLEILKKSPFLTQTLAHREIFYYTPKSFPKGDFSFVHDDNFGKWLKSGFEIMESNPDAWEILKKQNSPNSLYEDCFKDDDLKEIMMKIDEKYGHSGASMSAVMRHMWMISRLGWDKYVRVCITSVAETNRTSLLEYIRKNTKA